jgi:hypothetical protein
MSEIKLVAHPYPWEIMQARMDEAEVTGQPLVERPWWYEHEPSGFLFFDLFGCIGWPTEISDTSEPEMPGYAAVIGVIRPSDTLEPISPKAAKFMLLAEFEHRDVPTLLAQVVKMRQRFGFGIRPDTMTAWYGDPNRFLPTVCLYNESLPQGKDISITPPDDIDTVGPKIFDLYARSLRTAIMSRRLNPSNCQVFRDRLKEFRRNDPVVMATGGLIHTLLNRCLWMDSAGQTVFRLEDKVYG